MHELKNATFSRLLLLCKKAFFVLCEFVKPSQTLLLRNYGMQKNVYEVVGEMENTVALSRLSLSPVCIQSAIFQGLFTIQLCCQFWLLRLIH